MSRPILTGIIRKTLSASRINLLKNLSDVWKNKENKQRNISLADMGLIQLLVQLSFAIQKITVLTVSLPSNKKKCRDLIFFVFSLVFFFFIFGKKFIQT